MCYRQLYIRPSHNKELGVSESTKQFQVQLNIEKAIGGGLGLSLTILALP